MSKYDKYLTIITIVCITIAIFIRVHLLISLVVLLSFTLVIFSNMFLIPLLKSKNLKLKKKAIIK